MDAEDPFSFILSDTEDATQDAPTHTQTYDARTQDTHTHTNAQDTGNVDIDTHTKDIYTPHTHTPTDTHIDTHTETHTDSHTGTYTSTHTDTGTNTDTYTHTRKPHTYANGNAYVHTEEKKKRYI